MAENTSGSGIGCLTVTVITLAAILLIIWVYVKYLLPLLIIAVLLGMLLD